MLYDAKTAQIDDWLTKKTLGEMDSEGFLSLFTEFCARINNTLFPVFRCHITMHTLHTFFDHNDFTWYRTGQLTENALPRSNALRDMWTKSPLFPMLEKLLPELRLDMQDPENIEKYPIFEELSHHHVTDYFAMLIPFGDIDRGLKSKDGIMISWITDCETGFTKPHIETLRYLTNRFAVAAKIFKREQTLDNVLNAYLGRWPSEQILGGATQRGDGATIKAALWICDLRKSTELAFNLNEQEYLSLLNRFFEYMVNIVHKHNGEVLKFLGDGFLAIFSAENEDQEIKAAHLSVNAALDAERGFVDAFGQDNLEGFGIGIHLGNVMFGNIGSAERLDFSVTGSAVNITSRLQDLTKSLATPIIVSENIATKVDIPYTRYPNEEIRGSNLKMDVFSPHLAKTRRQH